MSPKFVIRSFAAAVIAASCVSSVAISSPVARTTASLMSAAAPGVVHDHHPVTPAQRAGTHNFQRVTGKSVSSHSEHKVLSDKSIIPAASSSTNGGVVEAASNSPLTPASAPTGLFSFGGSGGSTVSNIAPPDPNIAVGPTEVVEANNKVVTYFNRTGTSLGATLLASFDQTAGYSTFDPKVTYDSASGRFYLSIDVAVNLPACTSNWVDLFSSADPVNQGWTSFAALDNIGTTGTGGTTWADQPRLGISDNMVVVAWDYYDCSNNWQGDQMDIVQKSDIQANRYNGSGSITGFTGGPFGMLPVTSLSATATQYAIFNNSDPCTPVPPNTSCSKSIGVYALTGTPESGPVNSIPSCYPGICPTTNQPALVSGTTNGASGQMVGAQQKGTTVQINTDDDRLLSAIWETVAGTGQLWTASGTQCTPTGDGSNTRTCLNVDNFSASTGGAVSSTATQISNGATNFIGVTGAYLFYPALSMDNAGNVYVVYDESSSTMYPSIYVAGIGGTSPSFYPSASALATSGTYYNPGASGGLCSGTSPVICRWGDYSGAAQDPAHPTDVWVDSEYVTGTDPSTCSNTTGTNCWDEIVGRYTYAGPSITSLTPAAGPTAGGQTVTVSGSDFTISPATTATLGGTSIAISSLTPDSFTFTTPAHSAGYVNLVATSGGQSSAPNGNSGYIYTNPGNYVPLTPFRILDTRSGFCGALSNCHTMGPGGVLTLQLTGYTDPATGESIPNAASSVVLNVTAVNGNSFSLFTVWPNGTAQPAASNLNFFALTNTANLVTVTLGMSSSSDSNREVQIYNALGNVDVIADVQGYFRVPTSGTAGLFHPIPPLRVCDTRTGQPVNPCNGVGSYAYGSDNILNGGQSMKVNVSGVPAGVVGTPQSIPTNGTAASAVLNLTAINGTQSTYLSVFPTNSSGQCPYGNGAAAPPTSSINVQLHTNQANRVVVPLGPDSAGAPNTDVCVYNAVGSVNFALDANGWFGTGAELSTGYKFQPISPTRICDTRSAYGTACAGHSLTPGGTLNVTVAGQGGLPSSGMVAIVANLTAVDGSASTFLEAYPSDASQPNASDVNVNSYENLPNSTIVELSSSPAGHVNLFNSAGNIDAIIDVSGWFQ